MTFEEQYRILTEQAAVGAVAPRSLIAVRGPDRASYLHGILTNDIVSLQSGSGCYSAWLTPQGRMLTDMFVFVQDDMILLDVPAEQAEATLRRLDDYRFSEDVQVADLVSELCAVWIHGPAAGGAVSHVARPPSDVGEWPDYRSARFEIDGSTALVVRADQAGVPGYGIYVEPARIRALQQSLAEIGAVEIGREALDTARIEAGHPIFGIDMTGDTIPLEAGIEDRAISMTKGCYVGQEVIVRVLHRGHGRIARKLVGLRVDGALPPRGARLFAEERDIGWITSPAQSPRFGPIALGYVHRDLSATGSVVTAETASGRSSATVSALPFAG